MREGSTQNCHCIQNQDSVILADNGGFRCEDGFGCARSLTNCWNGGMIDGILRMECRFGKEQSRFAMDLGML